MTNNKGVSKAAENNSSIAKVNQSNLVERKPSLLDRPEDKSNSLSNSRKIFVKSRNKLNDVYSNSVTENKSILNNGKCIINL